MKIQRYTFYWLDLFLIISISITIPEKKRRGIIVLDLSQEPFSCPYISEVYPAFVKMTKKLDRNFSSKCLSHEKESLHKKPKAKFNSRKIRFFNLESHKKKKKLLLMTQGFTHLMYLTHLGIIFHTEGPFCREK